MREICEDGLIVQSLFGIAFGGLVGWHGLVALVALLQREPLLLGCVALEGGRGGGDGVGGGGVKGGLGGSHCGGCRVFWRIKTGCYFGFGFG